VDWWKFTDVSEVLVAYIIRSVAQMMKAARNAPEGSHLAISMT
jgi:hypothetical protein